MTVDRVSLAVFASGLKGIESKLYSRENVGISRLPFSNFAKYSKKTFQGTVLPKPSSGTLVQRQRTSTYFLWLLLPTTAVEVWSSYGRLWLNSAVKRWRAYARFWLTPAILCQIC